ncbi:MAG: AI-2E family transporter [Candidatus Acidiferrum sp.]
MYLLWVMVGATALVFGYFASSVCITLVLAAMLTILIDPIVTRLERFFYIPRPLTAALIIGLGMVAVGMLGYASYSKGSILIERVPQYAWRVREAVKPLSRKIEKVQETAGSLNPDVPPKKVAEVKISEAGSWPSYLVRGAGSVWGVIIIAGVVPFLTFFMLVRKKQIIAGLTAAVSDEINISKFLRNLSLMVRGFVMGNLIIGVAMALVTAAVLWKVHVEGAIIIGIASGFLNIIPFLGALLAAAIPMLAVLLQFGNKGPFIAIGLTVLALHLISTNFLIPKLVGSRVNIGPVAATIGMLFWGWLWGAMGLLLAIPLTACVKLVADAHPSLIRISNLLAESPRPFLHWARRTESEVRFPTPFFRKERPEKTKA